jgi:hypothetical protein
MPALPTVNAMYIKRIRDLLRTGVDYRTAQLELVGEDSTATILFQAQEPGLGGNDITIEVVMPAVTAGLSVDVDGLAITINLDQTDGTPNDAANTATLVAAAVNADAAASALVRAFLPEGSGAGSFDAESGPDALEGGASGSGVADVQTNPLNFLRAQDMSSVLELLQDAMDQTSALTALTGGSTTTVVDGAGTFVPGQQVGNFVKWKSDTTTAALRGLSYRILANTDRLLTTELMAAANVNGDTYEIVGGVADSAIEELRQGKGPADSPPGSLYGAFRIVQDALAQFTGKLGITQATGTLTLVANVTDGDTVTIGGKVYTFEAALTNVDGHVDIGATASDTLDNLIAAINLGAGSGTAYAAATTLHPSVRAAAGAGDTMVVTAKVAVGAAGNSIATTETLTNAGNVWAAATLTGGVSGVALREKLMASLTTGSGSSTTEVVIDTSLLSSDLRIDQFRGMRATISGVSRLIVGNDEDTLLLDSAISAPGAAVAVSITIPEDATAPSMLPGRVHPGGQPGNNRVLADHIAQAEAAVVAYTLPT